MMKFEKIAEALELKLITGTAPEEYEGVYAGDLLSRAMSHVEENNLWVTIMSNINVIAVASLTEAAAVILAEGVTIPSDVINAANEKKIAIFSSKKTVYDICVEISKAEQ